MRERLAGGDLDLRPHEVDPGDHLGHRMLDLQAGIHLDEVELAVLVQELDGAGARGSRAWPAPSVTRLPSVARVVLVEHGRGRLLDHLLMPALHRAVALAEMDAVAVVIGQDLQLDVARPIEVLLEIDAIVAEPGLGLAPGQLQPLEQRRLVARRPPCRARRRRPPP